MLAEVMVYSAACTAPPTVTAPELMTPSLVRTVQVPLVGVAGDGQSIQGLCGSHRRLGGRLGPRGRGRFKGQLTLSPRRHHAGRWAAQGHKAVLADKPPLPETLSTLFYLALGHPEGAKLSVIGFGTNQGQDPVGQLSSIHACNDPQ